MIRIFFENLGRSVLTGVIAVLVAGFLSMMIDGILGSGALSIIDLSVSALMIIDGILAVIVSGIWFLVAWRWDWFFSGKDDHCEHPPFAIFGFLLFLIIFLLFGGVAVYCSVTGYDKLVAAVVKDEDYKFLTVLFPGVAASQACYFLIMIVHYGKWQMCWQCGRMFCFEYVCTGSREWDIVKYKTSTSKENVGSISIGDRKIMDVSANVTRGHYETTHLQSSDYEGSCRHCGNSISRSS